MMKLDKLLPDGRLMTHHVIHERQADMQTFNIRVIIRSYPDEESVYGSEYADFYVDIQHTDYQFHYLDDLESQVLPLKWQLLEADEISVKTLSELKELKIAEINMWRSVARYSNSKVAVNGVEYEFQADASSQELLINTINYAILEINPAPATWRTVDNLDVTVTLEDLKKIASTIAKKTNAAYAHSFVLKAKVKMAKSAKAVKAIKW